MLSEGTADGQTLIERSSEIQRGSQGRVRESAREVEEGVASVRPKTVKSRKIEKIKETQVIKGMRVGDQAESGWRKGSREAAGGKGKSSTWCARGTEDGNISACLFRGDQAKS